MSKTRPTTQVFPTDLGWMGIIWIFSESEQLETAAHTNEGLATDYNSGRWIVSRLTFGHKTRAELVDHLQIDRTRQTQLTDDQCEVIDKTRAYAAGKPCDLSSIEISLSDRTPFQQVVLRACQRIGWGETTSYAELARSAGHPRSARAVGNVMASNRTPLLIPCHRVITSQHRNGRSRLGGFTAPGGVNMKQRLLELEAGCSMS